MKLSELSRQGLLVAADVAEQAGDQVLAEALMQMAQGGWDEAFFALARVERAEYGIEDALAHDIAKDAEVAYEVGFRHGNPDITIPEIPRIMPDLEGREADDAQRGYWVEMSAFVPESFQDMDALETEVQDVELLPSRATLRRDEVEDAYYVERGAWTNRGGWDGDARLGIIILPNGIETMEAGQAVERILLGLYPGSIILAQDVGLWTVSGAVGPGERGRSSGDDGFDIYLVPVEE